jgi:hypothetical protein
MLDCDTTSTDPVMHVGPFEVLDLSMEGHRLKAVERCRTCGNVTIRFSLRQEEKGPDESGTRLPKPS